MSFGRVGFVAFLVMVGLAMAATSLAAPLTSDCSIGSDAPTGSLRVVSGSSSAFGGSAVRTFSVEVEGGLGLDGPCLAEQVENVLRDHRSWIAQGDLGWQRVDANADLRVIFASPGLTDALCAPLNTGGIYSCRNGNRTVLNSYRWREGTPEYQSNLNEYRTYQINHEVGHYLGNGHTSCPGVGVLAPVMMQQTKGLDGCAMNGWPFPNAEPPPQADPQILCPDGFVCDSVTAVTEGASYQLWDGLGPSPIATEFFYGNPGDVPLMGDWNCDGVSTPAMYRPTNGFMYLRNSNTQGIAEIEYFYGDPSDAPLSGDWNGDGCDTLAIYRPAEAQVYIKNSLGTGVADFSYYFGDPGDVPISGDFDGDGVDTIGLHRASTGFVYFRNSHTAGVADQSFFYGDPGDVILAGDWDGDGDDTVAAYRPSWGLLFVNLANAPGSADASYEVGSVAAVLRSSP